VPRTNFRLQLTSCSAHLIRDRSFVDYFRVRRPGLEPSFTVRIEQILCLWLPALVSDSNEILAPIAAGGIGEVYRARDIKLDCKVAIKALPEALAQDVKRLACSSAKPRCSRP
jgi:serine/threonine protein kinase